MKSRWLVFLFLPLFSFSQKEIIRGQIIAETSVSGILVVNLTQQTQVLSDNTGRFALKAQVGDLLILSAIHLYKNRHLVEEKDFNQPIIIKMEVMPYEIEAVEIDRGNIPLADLGIPITGKRYTVAERRLRTATNWSPELGAGTMIGASISLDPLFNAISGRTKMLKNELKIERFNRDVNKTTWYLSDQMITTEFGIPQEYITDFRMYLIEDSDFRDILKKDNKKLIISKALSLAKTYKPLISDES